jgi:hypothetical protein
MFWETAAAGCHRFRRSFGDEIGGPARLLSGFFHALLRDLFRFGARLAPRSNFIELVVAQMLNTDERIVYSANPNKLIEFYLDGRTVTVLRILNQEDH